MGCAPPDFECPAAITLNDLALNALALNVLALNALPAGAVTQCLLAHCSLPFLAYTHRLLLAALLAVLAALH